MTAPRKKTAGKKTARPGKSRGPAAQPSTRSVGKRSTPSRPAAKPAAANDGAAPAKGRVRLQRALASAGFGSRRQCEELIVEGRVEVDGQIADQLGITIDPENAKVFVDGSPLKARRLVYYIVNKPTGVVTTNADPEGRPRVIDLVPPDERVFPVGRLDRSSEGLILLTNDGDLAQRLAHPSYEVQKIYRVSVAGNVQAETLKKMREGIFIAEGLVRVEGARILKAKPRATEMEITLKEGKNREIRRILARLGHKVQTLKRIAIGPIRLGEMPTGAYRRLSAEEVRKIQRLVETNTAGEATEGSDAPPPKRRPTAGGKRRQTAEKKPSPTRAPRPTHGGNREHAPSTRSPGGKPKRPSAPRSRGEPQPLDLLGLPKRPIGVVIGDEAESHPPKKSSPTQAGKSTGRSGKPSASRKRKKRD